MVMVKGLIKGGGYCSNRCWISLFLRLTLKFVISHDWIYNIVDMYQLYLWQLRMMLSIYFCLIMSEFLCHHYNRPRNNQTKQINKKNKSNKLPCSSESSYVFFATLNCLIFPLVSIPYYWLLISLFFIYVSYSSSYTVVFFLFLLMFTCLPSRVK